MNEEKIKVIKMLEEKKISSGEAMELLESLARLEEKEGRSAKSGGRFLRIGMRVSGEPGAGVSVSVPIAWSTFLVPLIEQKMGEKLREKGHGMDMGKISEALALGAAGKVVDINDNGIRAEISIG